SVYRALEALAELRLVKRVDAGDGVARFEPATADGDHHHHLVCRDCGKVEAFSDSRLERAIDRVAGGLGYAVDEHEAVLVGACADCSWPESRNVCAPATRPRATFSWYAAERSSRPSVGFVMKPVSTRIAGTSAQLKPVRSERKRMPTFFAPVDRTTADW